MNPNEMTREQLIAEVTKLRADAGYKSKGSANG